MEEVSDGTAAGTEQPQQLLVHDVNDFRNNCALLESALVTDYGDPLPDLVKLMTWVDWIRNGNGTPEHNSHFCRQVGRHLQPSNLLGHVNALCAMGPVK